MMKLKAKKAVTWVLVFLMVFAVVSNSTIAGASAYLLHTEDAEQSEQLNAGNDSVETFTVAGHLLHLQDLINHANKLLADTLVDVPPGVNTPGNRYWSTQEARDALIASITAAQIVLDAHGGGIQPGSLTIIPHSSCFNIPVYEAEIELFINNIRTVHQTETGIISIPNIPVGSSVRFNISTPCDTLYQFPKWEVAEGGIEIPPFAESPEFIMPDSCVFIIAEFETIAEYYFDWNMDLGWDNDSADALIGQFFEWYTDIALDISDSGQPLEWSYNSEIELTKDSVDWVDISTSEPLEYFLDLEYGKVRYNPYTLNVGIDSFSVSPQSDPNTWTPSAIPGSRLMHLSFGLSWTATVTTPTPWLTISEQVRVPPHTNDSFVINVDENFGNASRTGTIRVDFINGAMAEITVIQGHGPVLYLLGDTLSLPAVAAPPNIHSGGIVYVFANSNRRWNVDISGNATSWLSVGLFHPSNQTGIGEFAIMAQPNFGGQRTGTVTVSAQGVPGLSRTVTVVQAAGQVIVLSADELGAPAFPYSGTVNVHSNTTWNMPTSNVNWLTISNVTPPNRNGNGSFQINTTTANLGNSARTGTITVSAPGAHSRTVRVIQDPGQGLVLSGEYWESPANPSFANARIYSDRTWNMPTTNRDWLTISHVTPSNRTGNGAFGINTAPHTGNGTRTGTVTITAQGTPTRTVTVVQQPGPVLVLSADSGASPAASTFGYVAVTSNRTWNVTSNNPTWLRVDNFSPANRTGNGSFRITTTANTVTTPRTGTITVTADGAPTHIITITQAAASPLSLSISEWLPTSGANSAVVQVEATGTWFVTSSDSSWLTANVAVGNGNGSFRINTEANRVPVARHGTITVNRGGFIQTISVTQTADPGLRLSFFWNENEDRWFLLEQAVRIAGGSTSRNRITDAVTANVYGVTITFDPRMPGVLDVPGRGLAVRADVVYPRIVHAAGGEIVFLGGHRAFNNPAGLLHVYVKMFITQNSEHWGEGYFRDNKDETDRIRTVFGFQYASLGGGTLDPIYDPRNLWTLRCFGNRPSDLLLDNVVLMRHISSGIGAIDNLMEAHNFSRGQPPFFYNVSGETGYNSGSIISGLLHATGLHPGAIPSAPGWNNPVPNSFFGRS